MCNKHKQNHVQILSRESCKQRRSTWTNARYSLVENALLRNLLGESKRPNSVRPLGYTLERARHSWSKQNKTRVMPCCAAAGCSNRSDLGIRLYGFPADNKRRKLWEDNLKRENWTSTAGSSKLCEVRSRKQPRHQGSLRLITSI